MQLLNITVQLLNIAVQLENNCLATNGKIYTGYVIINDNHAVVQVMNISPMAVTIYRGTKLGKFTPLTELLIVEESPQQQPCQQTSSTIPPTLDIDFIHSHQQDLLTITIYLQLMLTLWGSLLWLDMPSIPKDHPFVNICIANLLLCRMLLILRSRRCLGKGLFNQVLVCGLHQSLW